MWGFVTHKDATGFTTWQDGSSHGSCGKLSADAGSGINSTSNMIAVPQCSWAREWKGPSYWGDPSGRETPTQCLWRHFYIGTRRCLPAVVSGFRMILVSGDIPHALLADSSDHSFLWQPHRSVLQQLWVRPVFHTTPYFSIIYIHTNKRIQTDTHRHINTYVSISLIYTVLYKRWQTSRAVGLTGK